MKFLPLAIVAVGLAQAGPAPEALTEAALRKLDPDIRAGQYSAACRDLNGDGVDDVLVLMNAQSDYCGSGGCTLFLFLGKQGGLEPLGSVKVVNQPVFLRKSSSHGMRDLLVAVRGGGAEPGLAVLQFDGSQYPASPGEALDARAESDEVIFGHRDGYGDR